MACAFSKELFLEKNDPLSNIQVRIMGKIFKLQGVVLGHRMNGDEKIYVILFSEKHIEDENINLKPYIYKILQKNMEKHIENIDL